jgi:hypothetical protein
MEKRKPGNPAMVKGQPSLNPKGRGAARDSIGKEVLEALRDSFHEVGGKDYLITMAQEDRRTYAALVAKVIPADVNHNVGLAVIDLSAAMAVAQARLESMSTLIDVTPASDAPGPFPETNEESSAEINCGDTAENTETPKKWR